MTHQIQHERALKLAKRYRETDAELLEVLTWLHDNRAFYFYDCTGVFDCCFRVLGLSEVNAHYFQRVTYKSIEVPALKTAVSDGTLTISQARRIEPVISAENGPEWIEKASTLTQKELEREVKRNNPNARPEVKSLLQKNLERLASLTGKGREDVLLQATEALLDKIDPERKAERAVASSRKPRVRKTPVATQMRQPIPASAKHIVVLEQGYKCVRCDRSRFLHYHHIVPVSRGGTNDPENLELLCGAHHCIAHAVPSFR